MSHLIEKKKLCWATLNKILKLNTLRRFVRSLLNTLSDYILMYYGFMRICITRAGQRNSQESINSFYHVGPEDGPEIRLRADIFACWATSLVLQNTFDEPKPLAKQRLQCYCLFYVLELGASWRLDVVSSILLKDHHFQSKTDYIHHSLLLLRTPILLVVFLLIYLAQGK